MSRVFALELPDGRPALGVVATRRYAMARSAAVCGGGEEHALDPAALAPVKPVTDVVVTRANADARGRSVGALDVGVEVGRARKVVRVHGERRVRVGADGALRFERVASLTSAPIGFEHAYGGRDRETEPREPAPRGRWSPRAPIGDGAIADVGAHAYPRNPDGRGFFLDVRRERLDGALAPAQEDPADPVTPERLLAADPTDWIDRPAAASLGPVSPIAFPRVAHVVVPEHRAPTRPVYELERGVLGATDLRRAPFGPRDPRFASCAPAGLGVARLTGGERVSLWNLSARAELVQWELPGDVPRFFVEPPGCPRLELAARLATVAIDAIDETVTLTWAALQPTAAPYPPELAAAIPHHVIWRKS